MTALAETVAHTPDESRGPRIWLGLLGVCSGVYVYFLGEVYVCEIVLVLLLPVLFLGWNRSGRSLAELRPILVALVAWLIGLVLGGLLVSGSTSSATVQYCADAIVTVISVAVVHRLVRTRGELLALLFGFGIGQLLTVVLQPSADAQVNAWKFGGAIGLVVILLCLNKRDAFARAVLVAVGLLSLVLDTRSLALIAVATLSLTVVADLFGRRLRPAELTAVFVAVLGGAGVLVSLGYSYVIRRGILGANATLKYDAQGHGSPLLVLLGGRDEVFFSLRSVWQHPFLGLGTMPTLSYAAATAGLNQMASLGLQPAVPQADQPGQPLPVHSYLFGGWVYGGILGLLCWVTIFVFVLRRLLWAATGLADHRCLVLFLGMFTLWDILYSPYGATGRFQLAVTLLALDMMVRRQARRPVNDGDAAVDARPTAATGARSARGPGARLPDTAGTTPAHVPRIG